jgi:hypothetical protein
MDVDWRRSDLACFHFVWLGIFDLTDDTHNDLVLSVGTGLRNAWPISCYSRWGALQFPKKTKPVSLHIPNTATFLQDI